MAGQTDRSIQRKGVAGIKSLMSAAHAAGYVMAVSDDANGDDQAARPPVPASTALVLRQNANMLAPRAGHADRITAFREWLQAWPFSRSPV